eukprot:PhM_4_TR13889/c1_g1_i6/m.56488
MFSRFISGVWKTPEESVKKASPQQPLKQDNAPVTVPTKVTQKEFDDAVLSSKAIADATNDDKLMLYALYKQATVGPCNVPKPGVFDVVGQAKWNAWKKLGDQDADAAKCNYVALVRKFVQTTPSSTTADSGNADIVDEGEATWDRVHNVRMTSAQIATRRKRAHDLAQSTQRLAQFDNVPPLRRFNSMYDVLRFRASKPSLASKKAFVYLQGGETETVSLTYAELDMRARAVAAELQKTTKEGDRAVLLYAQTLDFVVAFFGCIYAGVIAVPSYPPHPARMNRLLPRLISIVEDSKPAVVLTTAAINEQAAAFKSVPQFAPLTFMSTDTVPVTAAEAWRPIYVDRDGICFLQYTSGSTSAPKGVMVSHYNLCYNLEIFRVSGEMSEKEVGVSWLPVFHDLGLIGGVLCPVYLGFPLYLMSPEVFLQHPHKWLAAMSKYRGTFSGGPNFAFDLVVRKTTPEQRAKYDLSSWRIAFCGAEPVKMATINRFCDTFPSFPRTTFYPGYGLAESTLIIANSFVQSNPSHMLLKVDELNRNRVVEAQEDDFAKHNVCSVVSQGWTWLDNEIVIVDPTSNDRVPPMTVGELWVRGPTVCKGYWANETETEHAFHAQHNGERVEGGWLRTGDLAFVTADGEHFICGRAKDVIILNGSNYYPQDVEWACEIHTVIRKGSAAAFQDPDTASLILVQEVEDAVHDLDMTALCASMARNVLDKVGLVLERIVLVKRGAICKTSSGKIQRRATRKALLDDKEMDTIFDWTPSTSGSAAGASDVLSLPSSAAPAATRKAQPTLPASDVAIIGMGLRLPRDVSTPAALWAVLEKSQCIVSSVPGDRGWDAAHKYPGGFLSDPYAFDPEAFGLDESTSALWDPQHRMLLETVQDALDDAGITRASLKDRRCGVFVGIHPTQDDSHKENLASHRVCSALEIEGPCRSVDTACSSSLVALHDAVAALRADECDVAIVGGVNLMLTPDIHVAFTRGGFLAPDGLCKTFDASANGYVRGEGIGVIVVTKANTAIANNDRMYAIVKGTAVNQDGRSNGLTAPNGTAQEAVIKAALLNAGMRNTDVQYVEAHGTGTALGDPIELNAIATVLGKERLNKREVTLGSIKTNVGHLESAAGIMGLIKATLAIHHRKLPASLHFKRPNPNAKFVARCIQQTYSEWPQPSRPLVAGVSSFGFGGTNSHVILSEAPSTSETVATPGCPNVLLLSAATAAGLRDVVNSVCHVLKKDGSDDTFRSMCLASSIRRSHFKVRLALCARDAADMVSKLSRVAVPDDADNVQAPIDCLAFGYKCNASLAREMMSYDAFVETVGKVAAVTQMFNPSVCLPSAMFEPTPSAYATFAFCMGYAAVLKSWGVDFEACGGVGVGEVAAAVCAMQISLEDGVALTHLIASCTSVETFDATLHSRAFSAGEDAEESKPFVSACVPDHAPYGVLERDHWVHVYKAVRSGVAMPDMTTAIQSNGFVPSVETSSVSSLVSVAMRLHEAGVNVAWDAVLRVPASNVAPSGCLPSYPWARRTLNALTSSTSSSSTSFASSVTSGKVVYASDVEWESS